jgi:hypothetical protein
VVVLLVVVLAKVPPMTCTSTGTCCIGKTGLGSLPYMYNDVDVDFESSLGDTLRMLGLVWNVKPEVAVAKMRKQQLDSFIFQAKLFGVRCEIYELVSVLISINKSFPPSPET